MTELTRHGIEALHLRQFENVIGRVEGLLRRTAPVALFGQLLKKIRSSHPSLVVHAANSSAALLFSESHYDLVRLGLSLYGISPSRISPALPLKPVLSWKTKVVFLKTVPSGTCVSYGGTFRTKRTSRLATLPVGYADGYRHSFSGRAEVLITGKRCPVVGRVTMDQIVVDVTDCSEIQVGEDVVLLGEQGKEKISVQDMAQWASTLPYEIFCGISARVPRIYYPRG